MSVQINNSWAECWKEQKCMRLLLEMENKKLAGEKSEGTGL